MAHPEFNGEEFLKRMEAVGTLGGTAFTRAKKWINGKVRGEQEALWATEWLAFSACVYLVQQNAVEGMDFVDGLRPRLDALAKQEREKGKVPDEG